MGQGGGSSHPRPGARLLAGLLFALCSLSAVGALGTPTPTIGDAMSGSGETQTARDVPRTSVSGMLVADPAGWPSRGRELDPSVFEYAPPAPWAELSAAEIAAHSQTYAPARDLYASTLAYNGKVGDRKAIVILAQFSDVTHRSGGTQAYYDNVMNLNTSSAKSARTYYYENSYGNFTLTSTVVGWVTLAHTQAYYNTGAGLYDLVGDAAKAANSQVDFSQFDGDNDGYVDNLIIIHSGGDAAAGCSACMWSHSGAGYAVAVDGKYVQRYAAVAEFWETGASAGDALGVVVHEAGHLIFDLPDLYDVYYNNDGLGSWDLMAGGGWADSGRTPTHFSAWSKLDIGWIDPYVPPANVDPYTIYPTSDTSRANPVKIESNYTNEYFLVEFRSQSGGGLFDRYLPRDGLVVYHVDSSTVANTRYYNTVEGTTNHKGVDVEEVGSQDLDSVSVGDPTPSNDAWVSNAAGFTPTSAPNSNLYRSNGNYQSGIKVYNVSAVLSAGGPHMTFSLDTGRVNYGLAGRVLGGAAERTVLPGASVTYAIQFTTFASSGDSVNLSLEGTDAALAGLSATTLSLPSFGSQTVDLTVSIPGSWSAGDPAAVQVRATSTTQANNTVVVATLSRTAQIYEIDALGADALNATQVPEEMATLEITVRNLGNGVDNVTLSANYDVTQIIIGIANQPQLMARGTLTTVQIEVTVRSTVPLGTRIPVTLDIRYGPSAQALHAYYVANVTAGRYGRVSLDLQAATPVYLDPGVDRVFNLTVYNEGNSLDTIDLTALGPMGLTVLFQVPSVQLAPLAQATLKATVRLAADAPAWSSGVVTFVGKVSDLPVSGQANLSYIVKQRYELSIGGENAATAAPGARVVFNLVVVNLGNGLDNATVQVAPAFSLWNASLSATNLTLTAAPSGRSQSVFLTVTVPADAVGSLMQDFTFTALSQNAGVTATARISVLVTPIYSFTVTADSTQGAITNAESATFLITFRNTGNVLDAYSATVSGLPDGWHHEFAEGGVASIQPKFTGLMTLVITPTASTPADTYDFQIFATSEGDLAQRKILLQQVVIRPHREIQLEATPVDGPVLPGSTVTVRLIIKNLGNVEERLVLESQGAQFKSVGFDPFQVIVPPYQEVVASVVVILNDDQAPGYAPLVVIATSVSNTSVSAEQTVGLEVARAPQAPGAGAALAGAALAVAAAVAVWSASPRRRK